MLSPSEQKKLDLAEFAAREKAKRMKDIAHVEAMRSSFSEFIRGAWPEVEPRPLCHNWHIDAIAEHLQAVHEGRIRNLLINICPGSAKSLIVSVLWPAWIWVVKPEWRAIFTSYSGDLVLRDATRARNLIESKWYRETFDIGWHLSEEQNAKSNYENTEKGSRFSASVNSRVMGFRGDCVICLPYDSRITTDHGSIKIGDIVEHQMHVRILAFDHVANQPVWREIEGYESNHGRKSVAVTFSNGVVLEATNEHLVFTRNRGYVEAYNLKAGDRVIGDASSMHSLREIELSVSGSRETGQEIILQHGMSRKMAERTEQPPVPHRESRKGLRNVPKIVFSEAMRPEKARRELLLHEMPRRGNKREESPEIRKSSNCAVLELRESGETEDQKSVRQEGILQARMCRLGTPRIYKGQEQRSLRSREGCGTISCGLCEDSPSNPQAGRKLLPDVWYREGDVQQGIGCTPHRLHQDEQQTRESNKPVPFLSWEGTRSPSETPQMEEATVIACKSVPTPVRVYNIRVAGDHNYFANGILVHNCDDPLNSKEQYSDTALEECIFWWDNVISSRFNDMSTGSKVIIMQRLSDRDLSAHVLRQGGYVHLNLPTEFEPENKCVTSIGWEDPRKERGELMFPAMFPRQVVERIKTVDLGPDGFASQHQQHPVPVGGGMIKAHWWRYWEPRGANLPPVIHTLPDGTTQIVKPIEIPDRFDALAQSWDMSFTDSNNSDYVVGIVGAAKKADRFVMALVRERMDLPTTVLAVKKLSYEYPLAYTKYVEHKANGPAVIQSLRHEIGGFIAVTPDGNKISRAASGTPAVASGNWYLPHPLMAGWVKDFIAEAAAFPLGSHDDMVDAWSQLAKQFMNIVGVEDDDESTRLRIRNHKQAGWTA